MKKMKLEAVGDKPPKKYHRSRKPLDIFTRCPEAHSRREEISSLLAGVTQGVINPKENNNLFIPPSMEYCKC
jgi:hypothetical protein